MDEIECVTLWQHFVSQNLHPSDIPWVTHLNNLKSIQPQFVFGFVHYTIHLLLALWSVFLEQ